MDTSNRTLVVHLDSRFFVRWLKAFLVLVAAAVAILLLVAMKSLLLPFLTAALLTFLLEPVVSAMENRGLERLWGIVIVFVAIGLIIALGVIFLSPMISSEIQSIATNLQAKDPSVLIQDLKATLEKNFPLLKQRGLSDDLAARLQASLDALVKKSIDLLVGLVSAVSMIVTIPFITFFLLKDGRRAKKALIQLVPNRYFEMALSLVHKSGQQLGGYIRGQLLDALIVGILSIIALYTLHVRYAFLIGALAGLANTIPYLGPIVGAIPAILVALMDTGSFEPVIGIAVSFAAIQLLDNVLISPLVVSKSIDLHPLTVVIVVLVGGELMGVLGMLIAVPLIGILKVTITELLWGFKHYHVFGRTPQPPLE